MEQNNPNESPKPTQITQAGRDIAPLRSSTQSVRSYVIFVAAIALVIAIAGSVYLYLQQRNKAAQQPSRVKVGVMMAFSGGSSSMGYGANKGIQLAKKQLGADTIEIVQADSKCDPKTAAQAVKRLIQQDVIAIIGEGCSSASVAALPAANNARIPMISPSASSPTLSIPNDYFFRVIPPDTFQGEFIAQSIFERGLKNVAVFYTNEPYGTGMNKVFREKFEGLGGKVVATATAEPDHIDLVDQINQIKASNPEAIFIAPNSVVSGTAVIKLARSAGIKAPFFGADIFYDTTVIKNGGVAADGLTVTSFPTGKKSFKQALFSEYRVTEQLYAAPQAYDAFHLIYKAVQAGATTGDAVKNMLPDLTLEGVSGHISFDKNGEVSDKDYKYDLFKVADGQFNPIE